MYNIPLSTEQIASTLNVFASSAIKEIGNPSEIRIGDFKKAMANDPTISISSSLLIMRGSILIGNYNHPNKEYKQFINNNLKDIRSSYIQVIQQLLTAIFYGFSCAEIVWKVKNRKYYLDTIVPLDPELIRFKGIQGELDCIKYLEETDKTIPKHKIIHITFGVGQAMNTPYGRPLLRAVWPYYKSKISLLQDLIVAGKISSTGILLAQTDVNKKVSVVDQNNQYRKDNEGNHIQTTQGQILAKQLANLDSNSFIITDPQTTITRLPADGSTFNFIQSIEFLDKYIRRGLGIPDLAFSSEGIGSGITATFVNKTYNLIDNVLHGVIDTIKDQLIEKVAKPLLIANFGIQEDYGSFEYTAEVDPMMQMQLANTISSLVSIGILDTADQSVVDKLREFVLLPPITPEEMEAKKQMKALQDQAQMAQLDPSMQMTEGQQDPNTTPEEGMYP